MRKSACSAIVFGLAGLMFAAASRAEQLGDETGLPVLLKEDFEKGADRWQPTDPKAWKIDKVDGKQVYNQFKRQSNYKPPHRSPYNISLIKDVVVGSFQLDAKVKSTIESGNHRDVCLFFNYQNPAQFYYVHLGKKTDDHANQIFIVNKADRKKISTKTTEGTPWDDEWHHVRIIRDVQNGDIKVYFDDMKTPAMTANDKNFLWGQVGIGSFDDTALWDDIVLRGERVEKK